MNGESPIRYARLDDGRVPHDRSLTGAAPIVTLSGVWKTYRMGTQEVHALRGMDFVFGEGEYWAVMGASGSGKSTLLNLLGCLDRPTSGRFNLRGRDTARLDDNELSDLRLNSLGFVFQSFHLIPQLTVRENIELPLYYMGWSADRSARHADELAELVGLADRLDHRPAELSGGQQQRVAIARSLANEPDILLADEPTGNLDSETGAQIMETLDGLHKAGKTVILVTHTPEIAVWAPHHMYLRDGQLERVETRSGGV